MLPFHGHTKSYYVTYIAQNLKFYHAFFYNIHHLPLHRMIRPSEARAIAIAIRRVPATAIGVPPIRPATLAYASRHTPRVHTIPLNAHKSPKSIIITNRKGRSLDQIHTSGRKNIEKPGCTTLFTGKPPTHN